MNSTPDRSRPQAAVALPFGKHAGRPLTSIPTAYLAWALGIVKSPRLREALGAELTRREGQSPTDTQPRPRWASAPMAGHVILPPADGEEVPF